MQILHSNVCILNNNMLCAVYVAHMFIYITNNIVHLRELYFEDWKIIHHIYVHITIVTSCNKTNITVNSI